MNKIKKINLPRILSKMWEEWPNATPEGEHLEAVTEEELETVIAPYRSKRKESGYVDVYDSGDKRFFLIELSEGEYLAELVKTWDNDEVTHEFFLYYNPLRVVVDEGITRMTEKWREMEGKYKSLLAHATSDNIRREIVKEWLEERYKFLNRNRDKLEITEKIRSYYGTPIRCFIVYNIEDGQRLLIIDERSLLVSEKDRDDIDKAYIKIFKFLEGLIPSK